MSWLDDLKNKVTGKKADAKEAMISTVATQYEVNLVPDVKIQMIRAQKIRNIVLFVCIMVSVASVGVVLVLFGVKSGQDIAMSNQDKKLEKMSAKLADYNELEELVTIQRQLEKLSALSANKPVLSRVFGALAVALPTGSDVVQISELRADLTESVLRIEAQADARTAPLIDYRVLESFKKGVALSKYDYGRYVDANGEVIPTFCIDDTDGSGNAYREGEDYYAWWDLSMDGCAAAQVGTATSDKDNIKFFYAKGSDVEQSELEVSLDALKDDDDIDVKIDDDGTVTIAGDEVDVREEDGQTKYYKQDVTRVKIWRTPKFDDWHKSGYMQLSGDISGIQHFESECTQYVGTMQGSDGNSAKWTSTNECMLAPEGLTVISSSNGRDESNSLVLKFTASIEIDPEFFAFRNKHMMAIGPVGQNVTDSYVQVGGMFTQEARECDKNDQECLTNAGNSGGSSATNDNRKGEE